jgi:antitoxin component of MazEF toxin-antitoxin module
MIDKEIDQFVSKVAKVGNNSLMVIIPQKNALFSGLNEGDLVKVWYKKQDKEEVENDILPSD